MIKLNKNLSVMIWIQGGVHTSLRLMANYLNVQFLAKGECQGRVAICQYPISLFIENNIIYVLNGRIVSSATSTLFFSWIELFLKFLSSESFVSKIDNLSYGLSVRTSPKSVSQRRYFSSSASKANKILLDLKEELSENNISAHISAVVERFPKDSTYDIIRPFSRFIMRCSFIADTILTLNAKYGISMDGVRTNEYREELYSAITAAKFNLSSMQDTMSLLSGIDSVRISDKEVYVFTDRDTNISHERTLFLLNLVSREYKGVKFDGKIESVDQLNAFIRTDSEISEYYHELKCMFDFALTLDPVFFDAGVTPSEFKEFLEDKKNAAHMNVIKQATHKELAQNAKNVKLALINADSNLFVSTCWIYKFSRLTREMLPHSLNSLVIMNNPRVDHMELAYNSTLKAFKTYCVYYFKNNNVNLSSVMSQKSISHLMGFRFDQDSFKSYQELLLNWSNSKSGHGVK